MARTSIPPQLIVLDLAGVALAGLGLAALLSDLSSLHPALGTRELATVLAVAGFALMAFAVVRIVQHLRTARSQPPEMS
jgi:branched-subunit amino acid ABC-type transport system permease component